MSEPVRAPRLSQDEGQYLLRPVRRGGHDSIRFRRALIIMASASGTTVPAIARLVAADPDTVRDVIHTFNTQGWPAWALTGRAVVFAGSPTLTPRSSSRRPLPAYASSVPFTHWRRHGRPR